MSIRSLPGILALAASLGLLAACGPKPSSPLAGPTDTPAVSALPTYTPYPTFTPVPALELTGLYCEYEFCIGHPAGIPLFDLEVVNQTVTSRSSYAQGNLIGFDPQFYVFLVWSQSAGEFDPAAMIDFILRGDQPQDTIFSESLGGRTVSYVLLASTQSPDVLPYGLAAAWKCGDRAFGWKVYTPQDAQGMDFLRQALARFACSGGQ
jgi:hypothetical protein